MARSLPRDLPPSCSRLWASRYVRSKMLSSTLSTGRRAVMPSQELIVIISRHTIADTANCNQLAFMRDGKVIAQGPPAELQQAVGKPLCSLEDAFLYFIHREESSNA